MLKESNEFSKECFDVSKLKVVNQLKDFVDFTNKSVEYQLEGLLVDKTRASEMWSEIFKDFCSSIDSYTFEEKEAIVLIASRSGFKRTGRLCSFNPRANVSGDSIKGLNIRLSKDIDFIREMKPIFPKVARLLLSLNLLDTELFKETFNYMDLDNLDELLGLKFYLLGIECPFECGRLVNSVSSFYMPRCLRTKGLFVKVSDSLRTMSLYEKFVLCNTLAKTLKNKVDKIADSEFSNCSDLERCLDGIYTDNVCKNKALEFCKVMYELQH